MSTNAGPLAGLKVMEFAGIGPGPHVGMLLADLGAEVVRIDRPGGATMNPVVERARHRVMVDLKSEDGLAFCRDAASKADVLIEALGWIRRFRDQVSHIHILSTATIFELRF